jgi:hypothetical protein
MARTCKTVIRGGRKTRECRGSFPKGKVRTTGKKPKGTTPTPKASKTTKTKQVSRPKF